MRCTAAAAAAHPQEGIGFTTRDGRQSRDNILTSCCSLLRTSGLSARQCKVQVSTAAVVSWPAMSIVIKSSCSCLLVICKARNHFQAQELALIFLACTAVQCCCSCLLVICKARNHFQAQELALIFLARTAVRRCGCLRVICLQQPQAL